MDTCSVVLVVVTALSLAATYSLGKTAEAARESEAGV